MSAPGPSGARLPFGRRRPEHARVAAVSQGANEQTYTDPVIINRPPCRPSRRRQCSRAASRPGRRSTPRPRELERACLFCPRRSAASRGAPIVSGAVALTWPCGARRDERALAVVTLSQAASDRRRWWPHPTVVLVERNADGDACGKPRAAIGGLGVDDLQHRTPVVLADGWALAFGRGATPAAGRRRSQRAGDAGDRRRPRRSPMSSAWSAPGRHARTRSTSRSRVLRRPSKRPPGCRRWRGRRSRVGAAQPLPGRPRPRSAGRHRGGGVGAADHGDDLGGVAGPGPADLDRGRGRPAAAGGARMVGRRRGLGAISVRSERAGTVARLPARRLPAERPVSASSPGRAPTAGSSVRPRGRTRGHQPAADAAARVLGRDLDRGDAGDRDRAGQPPLPRSWIIAAPAGASPLNAPRNRPCSAAARRCRTMRPAARPSRSRTPPAQVKLGGHVVDAGNRPGNDVGDKPRPYSSSVPAADQRLLG